MSYNAIQRARTEMNLGNYDSAMEIILTAMSLIKQSSSDNSQGTQLVIESLQDRLREIEKRSHSSRNNTSGSRYVCSHI